MIIDMHDDWTIQDELESDLGKNERAVRCLWEDVRFCLESLARESDTALSFLATDNPERAMYHASDAESDAQRLTQLREKRMALESERNLLLDLQRVFNRAEAARNAGMTNTLDDNKEGVVS